jgi:hypothetical protein
VRGARCSASRGRGSRRSQGHGAADFGDERGVALRVQREGLPVGRGQEPGHWDGEQVLGCEPGRGIVADAPVAAVRRMRS